MSVPKPSVVGWASGIPGERFSAYEVAKSWGVSSKLVLTWIAKGWLKAARGRYGYRIRMKALRRAIMDHPEIAEAVLRPKPVKKVKP